MPANSIDDRNTCHASIGGAVQPLPTAVAVGARIRVRGAAWRLDALVGHDDCRELHLVDLRDDTRRVLLWPFDRPVALEDRPRWRFVRLRRWCEGVNATRQHLVEPCTPRARLADGRVLAYQLAPAVAVAQGVCRVLLADEVGLGKTVQAGWIVADLLAREPDARILIAVPAGLRRQWIAELSRRFGLACEAADGAWVRERVADLPPDVSPWAAPGVYVGSLDFLKRPDVCRSLDVQAWDLLAIDEAHSAASPTERYAAFAAIASRARRVVLVTATPYSGDPAAFNSTIGLGAAPGEPPPLMFRRSRAEVGDARRRRHHFARVAISRAEARLQRLLERYSREVWRESAEGQAARLAMTILRKRGLSSAAALSRSLKRRLALLDGAAAMPRQLGLFEDEEIDDAVADEVLAVPGLADTSRERRWLAVLIDASAAAAPRESKLRYLQRLLRRSGREAVLVFTEYRDTLLQLASSLPPAQQLHGGLSASERALVQSRFNAEGGLLLATDAAAEGLNLQQRCHVVVNYELPWNPARLEQRIGRVDRIGQRRAVHAITLVARDTAEDLVIANLARRLALVVSTLGERDRLGSFLTDVRTARLVIAGEHEAAAMTVEDAPRSSVMLAGELTADVTAAATHLDGTRDARRPPSDILVASMRSNRSLPPGVVVCVRAALATSEGHLVAARSVIVHVPCLPARPTAARARALAAWAAGAAEAFVAGSREIAQWTEIARAAQAARIDRLLARERAIRGQDAGPDEVQPGLFDRRAIERAADTSSARRRLADEHDRRVAVLSRSAELQLTCASAAALIAWR